MLGSRPLVPLRDRVVSLVLDNQAATTPVIIFEIMRGTRTLQEAERIKHRLKSLHVLPFLEADWSEAAEWGARLARKGVSAKSMDILISFKAVQHGLTLLHADKDFDRMSKRSTLKVESWANRIQE